MKNNNNFISLLLNVLAHDSVRSHLGISNDKKQEQHQQQE